MSEKLKIEIDTSNNPIIAPWLWLVGATVLIVLIVINVHAYVNAANASHMGQWGDFIGGTLNPILSFLAFAGLIYTVLLQRTELGLSREELRLTRIELKRSSAALEAQNDSLKQQRFESAFFGMISVLNQIIDNMDIEEGDKNFVGRDCFSQMVKRLEANYQSVSNEKEENGTYRLMFWLEDYPKKIAFSNERDKASAAYELLYQKYSKDIAHYFRVLYNIFNYISVSDFSDGIYHKILRAQLSDQELFLLFYNCNFKLGYNFKKLSSKFEIFDNLDIENLLNPDHAEFLPRKSFGKSK